MAVINAVGFETQGVIENLLSSVAAGVSWDTATKRSGAASGRCNPSAATAFFTFGSYNASTAVHGEMGRTAETFFTFYMYVGSLPLATMGTVRFRSSTSNEIVRINLGTGGAVTLVGTATSSTVDTLSTGQWYKMEMRVTSNGTCGLSIDGGTEVTITGNNFTLDRIVMGPTSSATADVYFDDLVIDDATFHNDPQITIGTAIGAGTHSAWTNGTGTTFAVVDEIPMNAADYIQNTAGTNAAHTFDMSSAATIGFTNTITAVIPFLATVEPTSATTSVSVRLRSGGTDYDSTAVDIGSATASSKAWIKELDPATGAAWTSTNFDAIEVGVLKGADSSSARVLEVYVMVLTTIVVAPAMLTLSTAAGLSTPTLALSSPALLALSTAAGLSSPTMSLRSPALLSLASDGVATASAGVASPALLSIATDGLSNATLSVRAPALLVIMSDGLSSASSAVTTPGGILVMSTTDGLSSASVVVISPALLAPSTAAGAATATAVVRSPALLTIAATGLGDATVVVTAPGIPYLDPQAAGLSSAAASITTPVFLALLADGTSSAAGTISTIAYLVPVTIDGVATAALVVISPALMTMQTDGVATSTAAVTAPANLTVSTIDGLSTAALAVKSPALLQLSASGLSATTIVVKSPALLSLTASGLASATALVRSPALMVIVADGTSLATISELSLGPSTKVRLGGAILLRPVLIQGGRQNVVRLGGGYSNPVRIPGGF